MELDEFLGRPQQHIHSIEILSWNVNGVKTKLERNCIQTFLLKYGIVCLNEVNTSLRVCLPGYTCLRSLNRMSSHRGGTIVMVKNYLPRFAASVDASVEDQVWLILCCAPMVLFGFGYSPRSDSPYFSHQSFSAIQEKYLMKEVMINI